MMKIRVKRGLAAVKNNVGDALGRRKEFDPIFIRKMIKSEITIGSKFSDAILTRKVTVERQKRDQNG